MNAAARVSGRTASTANAENTCSRTRDGICTAKPAAGFPRTREVMYGDSVIAPQEKLCLIILQPRTGWNGGLDVATTGWLHLPAPQFQWRKQDLPAGKA